MDTVNLPGFFLHACMEDEEVLRLKITGAVALLLVKSNLKMEKAFVSRKWEVGDSCNLRQRNPWNVKSGVIVMQEAFKGI